MVYSPVFCPSPEQLLALNGLGGLLKNKSQEVTAFILLSALTHLPLPRGEEPSLNGEVKGRRVKGVGNVGEII